MSPLPRLGEPAGPAISLLIAGWFAWTIGWPWSFVAKAALRSANFELCWLLKPIEAQRALIIDWGDVALVAVAVILISFGFSGLNA